MPVTAKALRLEEELRRSLDRVLNHQTRDLVVAWARAWDEIAPDLRDTLTELATQAESGTIKRGTLQRSKRLTAMLDVVRRKLEALARESGIRINRDVRRVITDSGAKQAQILAAQLPDEQDLVDIDAWDQFNDDALDAMVRRTTEKITADHKPLSDKATDAVRRELVRGTAVGSNPRHTAQRMVRRAEREFNGGLTRALVISRTETMDAQRAGAAAGQAQHADVLAGWVWLAKLTPRTCPACLSMHGRLFPLEEPGPHGHQQCRCSRMPKTQSWADLGFDGLDESADHAPDAEQYFAALPAAQQRAVLGARAYEAWASGEFPREEWAKRREAAAGGWRDSYVPAQPGDANAAGDGEQPPGGRPPAPPAGAGDGGDGEGPKIGPVLGDAEQRKYVKGGQDLPLHDEQGRLRGLRPDSAYNHFTYVEDPGDRATALMQYDKKTEEIVKAIARERFLGQRRHPDVTTRIRDMHTDLRLLFPASGVTAAGYTVEDLTTDVEAAAQWLLAQPVVPVAEFLYRGVPMHGIDELAEDLVDKVKAALQLTGWWYAAASPDLDIAKIYADHGRVRVLIEIQGASGVVLESMGRMSQAPEVLVSGRIVPLQWTLDGTTVRVEARWEP